MSALGHFRAKRDREESWAAFEADPEWQRVRAEANKDGPVLANIDVVFLKPTSFSALK
jgi:NIPSNAP